MDREIETEGDRDREGVETEGDIDRGRQRQRGSRDRDGGRELTKSNIMLDR